MPDRTLKHKSAPGTSCGLDNVPRGVEVLIKKAAVDAAFRDVLLSQRDGAAEKIGLNLEPAEAAMLRAIPAAQLEAGVAQTRVSPKLHAAFMTYTAAVMLAALGAGSTYAANEDFVARGVAPDYPAVDVASAETAAKDAGAVGGAVYDPLGNPQAGAKVKVWGRDLAPATAAGPFLTAVTAADGSFKIKNVPAGKYTVTCEAEGFRYTVRTKVPVLAGYTTQVNFALVWGYGPAGGARPDEPGKD